MTREARWEEGLYLLGILAKAEYLPGEIERVQSILANYIRHYRIKLTYDRQRLSLLLVILVATTIGLGISIYTHSILGITLTALGTVLCIPITHLFYRRTVNYQGQIDYWEYLWDLGNNILSNQKINSIEIVDKLAKLNEKIKYD